MSAKSLVACSFQGVAISCVVLGLLLTPRFSAWADDSPVEGCGGDPTCSNGCKWSTTFSKCVGKCDQDPSPGVCDTCECMKDDIEDVCSCEAQAPPEG